MLKPKAEPEPLIEIVDPDLFVDNASIRLDETKDVLCSCRGKLPPSDTPTSTDPSQYPTYRVAAPLHEDWDPFYTRPPVETGDAPETLLPHVNRSDAGSKLGRSSSTQRPFEPMLGLEHSFLNPRQHYDNLPDWSEDQMASNDRLKQSFLHVEDHSIHPSTDDLCSTDDQLWNIPGTDETSWWTDSSLLACQHTSSQHYPVVSAATTCVTDATFPDLGWLSENSNVDITHSAHYPVSSTNFSYINPQVQSSNGEWAGPFVGSTTNGNRFISQSISDAVVPDQWLGVG